MDFQQQQLEIEKTMESPWYKLIVDWLKFRKEQALKQFRQDMSEDKYDKKYTRFHLMDMEVNTLDLIMDNIELLYEDIKKMSTIEEMSK